MSFRATVESMSKMEHLRQHQHFLGKKRFGTQQQVRPPVNMKTR